MARRGSREALSALSGLSMTAALAAAGLVLAGCGTQADPGAAGGAGASAPPASSAGGTTVVGEYGSCPASAAGLPTGGAWWLDSAPIGDLAPSAVVLCTLEQRPVAGDGVWNVVVEKRYDTGLDPLVAALRGPDEPSPGGDVVCTLEGIVLQPVVLVRPDGSLAQVRTPMTACGKPQRDVLAALDALAARTPASTAEHRVERVRTQDEADLEKAAQQAGCSSDFKDLLVLDAGAGSTAQLPAIEAGDPRLCLMERGSAGGDPLLHFRAGGPLGPTSAARIVHLLAESRTDSATACSDVRDGQRVALIATQGDWVLVELEGCRRILVGDSLYGRATDALIAQLESLAAG